MEHGPVFCPHVDPAAVSRVEGDVEGVDLLQGHRLRPHEQRAQVERHGAHQADRPPVRQSDVLVDVALAVQHGPDDERAPLLDGDQLKGGEAGRAGRRRRGGQGLLPPSAASAVVLRLRQRLDGRDGRVVAVLP